MKVDSESWLDCDCVRGWLAAALACSDVRAIGELKDLLGESMVSHKVMGKMHVTARACLATPPQPFVSMLSAVSMRLRLAAALVIRMESRQYRFHRLDKQRMAPASPKARISHCSPLSRMVMRLPLALHALSGNWLSFHVIARHHIKVSVLSSPARSEKRRRNISQVIMSDLKAEYTAPGSAPESFKLPLSSCSRQPSTDERTAYLTSLRTSITDIQAQINVFLTQKMEEDNQKAGAAAAQDAKEEENYGEETVEED